MLTLIVEYCLDFVNNKDLVEHVDISGGDIHSGVYHNRTCLDASYKVSFKGTEIFTITCHGGYLAYALGFVLSIKGKEYDIYDKNTLVRKLYRVCRDIKGLRDEANDDEKASFAHLQQMKHDIQIYSNCGTQNK